MRSHLCFDVQGKKNCICAQMLIDYERINALSAMQIHAEKSDTKREANIDFQTKTTLKEGKFFQYNNKLNSTI